MTTITVSGAGGCINYEMTVIRKALEAAGVKVTVVNSCQDKDEDACQKEVYRSLTDDNWAAPYDWSKKIVKEVTLIADHIPWGG